MPLDDTGRRPPKPAIALAAVDPIAAGFIEIVRIIDLAVPANRAKGRRLAKLTTAWRVYRLQKIRRLVERLWDLGMAEAVKGGLIPDHTAYPEPAGTYRVVYAGEVVEISLAVAEPIEGINFPGFLADLLKAGVEAKLIKRLTRKHRTETKPAHRFTVSLIGG